MSSLSKAVAHFLGAAIKQPPPPLVERREDIHQAFQDVIFKAIARPEDRYASAGAMADALKSLMPNPLQCRH